MSTTGTSTGTAVSSSLVTTLGGIRRKTWELSHRSDLLTDPDNADYSDNGMNWFINNAQRRLDRELPYHKSQAWLYYTLAANESLITFQNCRYVVDVLWQDTDDDKTRYVLPWKPVQVGLATEQLTETSQTLTDTTNIVFGTSHYAYKGIEVDPVEDASRRIVVLASWYNPELVDDADVSFWTLQEPSLLCRATILEMELTDYNTQGLKDIADPLRYDLQKLANNLIAEEVNQRSSYNCRVL